jgi:Phage integrase family
VAAGPGTAAEHALISLLALNGLRVSEATGADIDNLGIERGHRTLVVTRKGGKVVTMPLAPRTARAIDLAIGERTEGAIFTGPDGRRLDRHGAARIVRRAARRAGINKLAGPYTLRHAFITAALDAGCRCEMCRKAPRMPTREPRCATTGPGPRWTGTPRTLSRPMSPGLPGSWQRPDYASRPATTVGRREASLAAGCAGLQRRSPEDRQPVPGWA